MSYECLAKRDVGEIGKAAFGLYFLFKNLKTKKTEWIPRVTLIYEEKLINSDDSVSYLWKQERGEVVAERLRAARKKYPEEFI